MLLFAGPKDTMVPVDTACMLAQALPYARLQLVEGPGHHLPTGPDGATAQAWLQTGESYAFTAAAGIRAVEETFTRSPRGALSPAAASGADFAFTIQGTTRIDTIPAEGTPETGKALTVRAGDISSDLPT